MLRDYIVDGHICHIEEGKKLKLGDVRLYPLLFEFNGKKCQSQRLLRRGKIRKQDQQSLTPYFFRDRETRELVFHWLTARVCKKTERSLEEGGDAEKITALLNSYALREMFLNNNKIRAKGTQNIVNSLLVNQRLHKVHLGEKLPMSPKLARKRCINPLVLDTRFALPLPHALPTGLPARHEATHSLPPSPPPSPSPTLRRSGLASLRLSSPSSPPLKGLLSSRGPGISWVCRHRPMNVKQVGNFPSHWRGAK